MSERPVRLRVLMPNQIVIDKEYDFVRFSTTEGDVGVLPGHENYSGVLNDGIVVGFIDNAPTDTYTYLGGVVSVFADCVSLLSSVADTPQNIYQTIERLGSERKDNEDGEKTANVEMHRAEMALRHYLVQNDVSAYSIIKGNSDRSEE
ncbi:MAG: hypothetical protein FWE66_00210 [Oscillospiraceae bacterium]|nr:hypothetical protein [Oscillospiraceae bacterium]